MSEPHGGMPGTSLAGKIALITGGAKNIGRAIALTLARAGAVPVILYHRDEQAARALCAEITASGGRASSYQADLADVAAVQRTAKSVEREFGGVDILVKNAAIRPLAKIADITPADWDLVMATNLRGPFFLCQALLPGMVRRQWGRIINIGGLDGYWGKPRRAHNVSAKMGLVGLTRALANEVARFGITVNIVIPGTIDTQRPRPDWYPQLDQIYAERRDRVPMARLGLSQEVANACVFLASELASFTTAQEYFVSGGAFPLVRQPTDDYPAEEF